MTFHHVPSLLSKVLAIVGTTSLTGFGTLLDNSQKSADTAFWNSVYQDNHVVEISISLTKEAWEKMQPAQSERGPGGERGPRPGGGPDGPPPRGERGERGGRPSGPPPSGGGSGGGGTDFDYVKADITVDGETLRDSGLRFKGNSSYRMSTDSLKRPLKIDTNRFVSEQDLHGRTKFNLSNSFRDPAFMKEKLAYETYQAAGLPTPGIGWATVTLTVEGLIKKQNIGIYVIIEQVDKNYLARQFGEASKDSLLMKPETTADWRSPGDDLSLYEEAFDIKEGADNPDLIRQFADFLAFIEDSSDTQFAREIGQKMDLDLLAGYLAATSALASLDSYVAAPHNYYLMIDQADGKVRLLPWDLNEAFGTHTMGTTAKDLIEWDITHPWASEIPLLDRLFKTSDFPNLYNEKLQALMKGPFTERRLFSRIETFKKALKPHLNKEERANFQKGISGSDDLAIKPFIEKRISSIASQLAKKSEGRNITNQRGLGRSTSGSRRP